MWKGMSDEADIVAWAEALPKWHWDGRESEEYKARSVQTAKEQWANASEEQRAEWCKANKDAQNRPEVQAKRVQSNKDRWANASEEERAEWCKALSDAYNRPEVRAKHVQAGKDMWANASEEKRAAWSKAISDANNRPEVRAKNSQSRKDWWANQTEKQKTDRIAKQKTTMNTEAYKGKRRKLATDQHAIERRAELERARPIALPFEKSKRLRAELRAASTDFSGLRGNAVLYMVSEDGKTIRRVNKNGLMGKTEIVGPVVDPAPPDAYVSDSKSD